MEAESAPSPKPPATSMGANSPGAKRAVQREKVDMPPTFPQVPHDQVVQEVQRMAPQAEADARFFDGTYEQINDHAEKLGKIKDGLHKQIARMDQAIKDLVKLATDVDNNDANLKQAIAENDRSTKKILENNDATTKQSLRDNDTELKDKLRALEGIVTEQGLKITLLETSVHPGAAASATGPSARSPDSGALGREVRRVTTKVDIMDDKYNASVRGLEAAITQMRNETVPQQANEVLSQMTTMASKFAERMDTIEQTLRSSSQNQAQTHSPVGGSPGGSLVSPGPDTQLRSGKRLRNRGVRTAERFKDHGVRPAGAAAANAHGGSRARSIGRIRTSKLRISH